MLGVDVTDPTVPGVLPGDDGAAGAVRDDRGRALVVGGGADRHPVRGPLGHAAGTDAPGVDVVVGPGAEVLPGDDGATGAVRGDRGFFLVERGVGDGDAVGGPAHRARRQHALSVDIGDAGAGVFPGDDGATR